MSNRTRDGRSASPRGSPPQNFRVRDYPPAGSHDLTTGEQEIIGSAVSPSGQSQGQSSSSPTIEMELDDEDEIYGIEDPDKDITDSNDNPPLRDGLNVTTIGFEFELGVAVARRHVNDPDPHPKDGRWLSNHLITGNDRSRGYRYTCKNRIVDTLVASGVVARKGTEYWIEYGEGDEAFQYWDSWEYRNPNQNDVYVSLWQGEYHWNGSKSNDENVEQATNILVTQFWQYHRDRSLATYLTRQELIENIKERLGQMILGVAPTLCREKIKSLWLERVVAISKKEKEAHYTARGPDDPNYVKGAAANNKYETWSVTDDVSVEPDMLDGEEFYYIPADSVPTLPLTGLKIGEPPNVYRWFGAEVVSPVMDYDNPEVYRTLRKVARALRYQFRIHKPTSGIQTGVHIHIGQLAGWTLLHLKKLATLWHVMEPFLFTLHRRDRADGHWCLPMNRRCALARYVYDRNSYQKSCVPQTTGPIKTDYMLQMDQYIPDLDGRYSMRQFIDYLWQYKTIDSLSRAMGAAGLGVCNIRWRVTGLKLSQVPELGNIQTLEFRLMQGTLDADHIWKWASIIERLVVFSRDSAPKVFRDAIADIVRKRRPASLGLNPADLDWFKARTRNNHFTYPDNDIVNWRDPFMVQGHGDTHDTDLSLMD